MTSVILDAHTHLDMERAQGDASRAAAALAEEVRACGVSRAILLPLVELGYTNDDVAKVIARHPELIGFATVHPHDPQAEDVLTHAVQSQGLKGLKLHPRLQKFTLLGQGVEQLLVRAGELGVPVIIDCFPDRDDIVNGNLPVTYDRLARLAPRTRIVMAHLGGHHVLDAMMVVKRNPNLFMDLSFSLLYYRGSSVVQDIGYAIRNLKARKVLYGSDYPDRSMKETLEQSLILLDQFSLNDQELHQILSGNAEELLASAK